MAAWRERRKEGRGRVEEVEEEKEEEVVERRREMPDVAMESSAGLKDGS